MAPLFKSPLAFGNAVPAAEESAARAFPARPTEFLAGKRLAADMPGAQGVLAALIDSVSCGVLLFGPRGELSFASERFLQMFRMDRETLARLTHFDALVSNLAAHLGDSESVAARWRQRFRRNESSWDQLELLRPSRTIIEHFTRPVFDTAQQRIGWLEIHQDVTAQRLIERKLMHTERMAAIGQMVSGIAHELNNPLTSVLGYAQLLLTRRSGKQRDSDLRRVLQQAERASSIAKNLLLLSRQDLTGHCAVDLNEVVKRTLALRSYELRLENILVQTDLSHHLPDVLADAGQLQQVLLNLIVNAEHAILQSKESGLINIRTRQIASDRIVLAVADDGPGISQELLPRIFDPFFTTKPVGVGTGLGLSIVYSIVQDHGGQVSVDSSEGHGATFTVELQTAAANPRSSDKSRPAADDTAAPTKALSNNESILVVEDEPTVASLIADVLGEDGYIVDVVLDSREGLDLVRHKSYDLVVCDLRMPHMDGRSFYRELVRQRHPLEHRLVFVTGDTLGPRTVEFLEESGVPYLAKPFLVEELKEVVHRTLGVARQEGEAVTSRIVRRGRASDERIKGMRHE